MSVASIFRLAKCHAFPQPNKYSSDSPRITRTVCVAHSPLRKKNTLMGVFFGADGEIRTLVPITRQTHFECVPVRPLRYICKSNKVYIIYLLELQIRPCFLLFYRCISPYFSLSIASFAIIPFA